jgi:hypothetical protein
MIVELEDLEEELETLQAQLANHGN